MKGQKPALREVVRQNTGRVYTPKEIKEEVAKELSKELGVKVLPKDITLLIADEKSLLEKVNVPGYPVKYKCLPINSTQQSQSGKSGQTSGGKAKNSKAGVKLFPIEKLNIDYFIWLNPDFYKYNTSDQVRDGMFVFLINTKTHKGVNLDALAQHVISLPYIAELKKVFLQLNSVCKTDVKVCKVKFVPPDEIKKLYMETIIWKLKSVNDNLEALTKQCEPFIPESWEIHVLNDLHEIIDRENGFAKIILFILEELIPSIKNLARENPECVELNDLLSLLIWIKNILSIVLLGFYSSDTIYLCLENIVEAAQKDGVTVELLADSVLAHEYAHHVHLNLMTGSFNNGNPIHYDAVVETVAETVQTLFAEYINDSALITWMENHSKAGVFPGWGYGGTALLSKLVNSTADEEKLLDLVINLSLKDWNNAYYLMNNIVRLATKVNINVDHYIFSNSENIWALSELYVPYPGSANSLTQQQSDLKNHIQSAFKDLNPTGRLFAEFSGITGNGSDIENLLFYNIKNRGLFDSLTSISLDFMEASDIKFAEKGLYFYHYATQNDTTDISGVKICEWNNFDINKANSTTTVYDYYNMMKTNNTKIKVNTSNYSGNLKMEITINYSRQEFKPSYVVLILKPLIDGIVCGLHAPYNINTTVVSKRVASKYNIKPNDIECQLNDNTNTCLPKRNYVKPYRGNVAWNPQDYLLKYVQVKIIEDPKVPQKLSISGKLFKI